MSTTSSPARPPLESVRRHRRQSFWQITFPVLAVTLLLVSGLVVLFLTRGGSGTAIVADYALMLLVLPLMLAGAVLAAAVIALTYGTVWIINRVTPLTNQAQYAMQDAYQFVENITGKIASMMIGAAAALNGMVAFVQQKYRPPQSGDTTDTGEQPGV